MNQDQQQSSRLVPLIGGLGILMVAAGVIVGMVQALRVGPVPVGGAPPLAILAPAPGDTVEAPVGLQFSAGSRLVLGPTGWTSDDLHLHAYIDGREVMPAAADITPLDDGTFRWSLPVTAGERRIQLRWAAMDHGTIEQGASAAVPLVVR